MGRKRIQFEAPESLKNDIEKYAEEADMSVSEYMRESARRQMMDDIRRSES